MSSVQYMGVGTCTDGTAPTVSNISASMDCAAPITFFAGRGHIVYSVTMLNAKSSTKTYHFLL